MAVTRVSRARVVSSIVAMNGKVERGLFTASTRINDTDAIDRQDGAGSDRANRAHSLTASLNNDATVTYGLNGNSGAGITLLTDQLGDALALTSVSALKFTNEATSGTGYFEWTPPADFGGSIVRVPPGVSVLIAANGVAGASAGTTTITNKNGASASFSLTFVGVQQGS